MQKIKVIKASR